MAEDDDSLASGPDNPTNLEARSFASLSPSCFLATVSGPSPCDLGPGIDPGTNLD